MKSSEIVELLRNRFSDKRHYVYATEVFEKTGGYCRRIDFCVMSCYESENYMLEGIEIKVDKADLENEIRMSAKHNIFFDKLDLFSLACPKEVLDTCSLDIPKNWGIYVVNNGSLRCKRRPTPLSDERDESIDKGFVASFLRRALVENDNGATEQEKEESYSRGYRDGKFYAESQLRHAPETKDKEMLEAFRELFPEVQNVFDVWKLQDASRHLSEVAALNVKQVQGNLKRTHEIISQTLESLGIDL